MKNAILSIWMFCALAAVAVPTVSEVSLTVNPLSPNVKVTYKVSEDSVVTVKFLTNGVAVADAMTTHLVGDVCRKVLATGDGDVRTLWWASDMEEWPDGASPKLNGLSAEVTAWATNAPPLYMAADLVVPSNVLFYASKDSVPGGITNNLYKTTKMLFRKIPAKEVTWWMGQNNTESDGLMAKHQVVFSDDYYIGVYEVTQRQNVLFAGANTDQSPAKNAENADLRAYNSASYAKTLGSSSAFSPSSSSYIGKLIARTGIESLNLPTEAQWEYACRALTGEKFCWGSDDTTGHGDYAHTNTKTKYSYPQVVGELLPNAWDLYDMTGNVFEICLDYFNASEASSTPVRDPVDTTAASTRMRRGGCYNNDVWFIRSSRRTTVDPSSADYSNGYRLVGAAVAY